jgi:methyl halide transferase
MVTSVDDPSFWDKRYVENNANWDLKTPTPVFVSLIQQGKFIFPSDILLPGCGKGHDAVFAAEKGFKVTAVDFSEEALQFARKLAQEKGTDVNFLNEDIFQLQMDAKFDFIFDYTTYCAINPSRRKEYAYRMNSLLKPGGRFIALLFPVDGRPGGPPYNVDPLETYKIFSQNFKLEYYSRIIESIKPRKGKEVLHIYKKVLA